MFHYKIIFFEFGLKCDLNMFFTGYMWFTLLMN